MRLILLLITFTLIYSCSSYKNATKSYETYRKGIVPKSNEDLVWQEYLVEVKKNNDLKEKRRKELDSLKALKQNNTDITKEQFQISKDTCIEPKYKHIKADGSTHILSLNDFVNQHIKKYFNYPEFAMEYEIQGRVNVQFIIDKEGKIQNIYANGPENGLILEQEALRIMSKLPIAIEPAICADKSVNISYAIPIVFKMNY